MSPDNRKLMHERTSISSYWAVQFSLLLADWTTKYQASGNFTAKVRTTNYREYAFKDADHNCDHNKILKTI